MAAFTAGDLVDFVKEDDAGIFHAIDGGARDLFHVDQALLFFLNQVLERLVDLHLPLFGALAEDVGQHVLEVDVHLLDALVGDDFEGRKIALAGFDFNLAVVELAFAQLLAKFFAGARLRFPGCRVAFEDESGLRSFRRTRSDRRQQKVE